MGTWNAFYVKRTDEVANSAVRHKFPQAKIESNTEFLGVNLAEDEFVVPERTLADLSAQLATDIFWMSFQSVVDAFQFYHWRAGENLRCLVYGCFKDERTWERVEGSPEPWEREVLFNDKKLEFELEFEEGEEDQQELRRIWQEAELLPGRTKPSLNSRNCAHQVAQYYAFPGYGT